MAESLQRMGVWRQRRGGRYNWVGIHGGSQRGKKSLQGKSYDHVYRQCKTFNTIRKALVF